MRKSLLMILLGVTFLLTLLNGCANRITNSNLSSQFDIEVADIGLQRNTAPFAGVYPNTPLIVSTSTDFLIVDVNITPKSSFTGGASVYLAKVSKDGYYFGRVEIPQWTQQELQTPSPSERNINVIKAMEAQRIKQVKIAFPLSDKDVVAFLADINTYTAKVNQEGWDFVANAPWSNLLSGNTPSDLSAETIMSNIRSIFDRYFSLKIITKEEAADLDNQKLTSTTTQNIQQAKPSISLISPNGGEVWHIGDNVTIRWSSVNYTNAIYIQLSYDSGKTWGTIISETANTGSHEWLVAGEVSLNCRIRICQGGTNFETTPALTTSASDFTISTQ